MVQAPKHESPRPRNPGQARNSEHTKAEILRIAGRLFAAKGYTAVRLLDIANGAGITPALIVRYFQSKRALFELVVRSNAAAPAANILNPSGMANRHLTFWRDPDAPASALALIRSLDLDDAGEMLLHEIRERASKHWYEILSERYEEPEARVRTRLLTGLMMGSGFFSVGALLEPDLELSDEEWTMMARQYARAVDALVN